MSPKVTKYCFGLVLSLIPSKIAIPLKVIINLVPYR
jgi:hypothetical protein